MKIASFDVDAQKGFTPLCPDELPVLGGDEIVDELNAQALLADYRVGSKDSHPPNPIWLADENHPQFSRVENGGPNVDVYWNGHARVGTKGNELLDGLPKVKEYNYFVFKGIEPDLHPYGACYHDIEEKISTGVIEYLRSKGVKIVILGGLALDYCLATTAIQLSNAGFHVIINLSATRAVNPANIPATCDNLVKHNIRFAASANSLMYILGGYKDLDLDSDFYNKSEKIRRGE